MVAVGVGSPRDWLSNGIAVGCPMIGESEGAVGIGGGVGVGVGNGLLSVIFTVRYAYPPSVELIAKRKM